MISRVRGTLVRRDLGAVEITTAGGVTYEIEVPLTVYEQLPREGQEVELRTFHVQREDDVRLYGFIDGPQRSVFARLLTASGVGPRLALNMLSTMSADRLVRAILERDVTTLRQIPGLGTKKAQKLVLELADRLSDLAVAASDTRPRTRGADEAVSALVSLGYSQAQAAAAVRKVLDTDAQPGGTQQLIRAALAALTSG
ncbi:MAG: Holliday junction branch migration protein RuvA [Gemmatimonadetes bacterium]|nr:Holliday junction branch migration protein RuvA [Gemmatimonadota bacterium]